MQAPGEEMLLERACRGDPAAFEELVLAYQSLAFRTAFVIAGGSRPAQPEVAQTYMRAEWATTTGDGSRTFQAELAIQ